METPSLKCRTCGTINPIYEWKCVNCGAYLREKIANLNLLDTISLLVERPSTGFFRIIQSEQKNYIFVLLALFSVKVLIFSAQLALIRTKSVNFLDNVFANFLLIFLFSFLYIIIYSFILKKLINMLGNKARIRDIYSVIVYSLYPLAISAVFLFPLELSIFGGFWFSLNPSPLAINKFFAYMFIIIEVSLLVWSMSLYLMWSKFFFANLFYSSINLIIFYTLLLGIIFIFSLLLFNQL